MDIVVDASAIIAVIANEPERGILVTATTGADLIAPCSVNWEIGNAFSAMLRRRRITLQQALDAIKVYETISIRFLDVELRQSLEIAAKLNIYAYDAYLIQCALKCKSPLLSLDRNLINSARQIGADILEVFR